YVEGADDPNAELDDRERRLPQVGEGDPLSAEEITVDGHATKPPARYTEASLVKELEEREIGRPSTYASIIGTILDRGYVFKKGTALVPSFLSFAVVNLLEKHFGRLVDYDFTAKMEDDLDRIARGEAQAVPWLKRFYFGEGTGAGGAADAGNGDGDHLGGLKELVTDLGAIDAREVSSFPVGNDIVLRVGRYGPYIERGEKESEGHQRADIPSDLAPDELTVELAEELLAKPSGDFELGTDPETGHTIVAKDGRYGPYVTEVLPEGTPKTGKNAVKPRTASLFKSMSLDTVTLEDALKLMSLPRIVGTDADGVEITAQNGRYGPYLKKGTDSRSLQSEDQLFTITLEEAQAIYAQPKQRGRAAAKPPLKELGEDPVSGKPVVVKDGRFGPYVTDGETNATLRSGDSVETITPERGFELLAEKRAKGPAKKTAKKAAAKKAPAKKATAAKKTAAKKTTAAKTTAAKKTTAVKKTAAKKATASKTVSDD
ncbi:topoisomerase C-terminal repeat-containing protein, partial [Streptomyces sp. KR55]|uniref:topoisomerase C-terminal repeat-containing protein n=1 Tax=Streptomyces sp. KR55 TaxID=3457425 RepID=UPI003FD106D3